MKKFFLYIAIFVSGAVAYQIMLIVFFGTFDYKPEKQGYGISDDYVKGQFREVCNFLESNGCGCYPVIHTDRSCKATLKDFILEKTKDKTAQ